ncbi:MAG: metallophosphoesterase family protein [Pseudomonadota bacterium]
MGKGFEGMQAEDWGEIEGPALLFGGPVGNLQALEALQAEARAAGVGPEHWICTGDLAAYCGDPGAVMARARALGFRCIKGNMEEALGAGDAGCGCGFDAGTACDLLSRAWYARCTAETTPRIAAWMAGLPARAVFRQAGRRFAVIHGGATQTARFLWPVTAEAELAAEIAAVEAQVGPVDGVVCGHSGLPFVREVAGTLWINAGTLGMPPHDGDPRTAFAWLDGGRPRLERLAYDHAAAARSMRAAGLTQGYDAALHSGWWPSEDVLPSALRRPVAAE